MWESQVLLTDGQVFFPRVLRFSPTFDERSARYKWNILERAVKPKSKKKKKKKKTTTKNKKKEKTNVSKDGFMIICLLISVFLFGYNNVVLLKRFGSDLSKHQVSIGPTAPGYAVAFTNSVDPYARRSDDFFRSHITKTRLFKYIDNFTSKNWKISDKKLWYFSYFCSKHRLWVLVRTASARRF